MTPVELIDETRNIGKPSDWEEERDGPCSSLSVADHEINGKNVMISAWQPSAKEIEDINNGGFVYLCVYGTIHPVVALTTANH